MRSHPWRDVRVAGYPGLAVHGEAFAGQSIHWIDCLIRLTLLVACVTPLAVGADSGSPTVSNLVRNIIELRGDLESLDGRLQRLESEHEARMSSLARREGELLAQRSRQELTITQVERRLVAMQQQTHKAGVVAERLTPVLKRAIEAMRNYVKTSLPFKRGERLAALTEIRRQLDTDALEPPRLANRLWTFYADELRLTGDSALYRQPVVVQGDERLADVARLGMMALYFRGDNGRFGYAARQRGDWVYRYLDAGAPADNVAGLFGSLHKQLRTGYFRLPHLIDAQTLQRAELPTKQQPMHQAEAQ